MPPADRCPFCPVRPGAQPAEVPLEQYEIAVLQNRFPSFSIPPPPVTAPADRFFTVEPARGVCEVVLYSQDHHARLSQLPLAHVRNIVEVWTDRFNELRALPGIAAVYLFENNGAEVGVTLHHPHGQIYAYPFVPPVLAGEIEALALHEREHGRCLLCDLRDREAAGERLVYQNAAFTAFVPFAARWPYEVHLVSRRHAASLPDFDAAERDALADTLRRVLRAYDALFERPFPYVMAMHQDPVPHFHIELYPPLRSAERLKYLAGSELGAGTFIDDVLPEQSAAALRAALERSA